MTDKIFFDQFCDSDPFWDHNLSWNTSIPQLTRCFHQTALVWPQTIFLFFFTMFELIRISRPKNRPIPWNTFNMTRLAFSSGCVMLNIINFLYQIYRHSSGTSTPTKADILSPLFKSASMIQITTLLLFHRKRGYHTSALVWLYLFLETIFFTPVFYQIFIEHHYYSAIETVLIVLYFWMLITTLILCSFSDGPILPLDQSQEMLPTSTDQRPTERRTSPEIHASFLNQLTYWWFTPMAIEGWKKSLTSQDLWDLGKDMKTQYSYPEFAAQLDKYTKSSPKIDKSPHRSVEYNTNNADSVNFEEDPSKSKSNETKNRVSILAIFSRIHIGHFLLAAFCKLLNDLVQFVTPQLLKYLIQFIETGSDQPLWHGFFIAISMFIVSTLESLFLNYYFYLLFMVAMRITSSLTAAIYRKALKLGDMARKETSTGEIVNLMAVDSKRFLDLLPFINLIWSAPLQIIVSIYFLYAELGYSALCGLVVMILMIPINALIAMYSKRMQLRLMKQKDQRTKFLNEILNGIKILKFYAWEESFMKNVTGLREKELKHLRGISYLGCVTSFLFTCAPMIVSVVTFSVYVTIQGETLTAQKAFVSLSLFNILRFPLSMLPQLVTFYIMASVSVKRINNFLSHEDLDPYVTRDEDADAIVVEDGHFKWASKSVVLDDKKQAKKSDQKSDADKSDGTNEESGQANSNNNSDHPREVREEFSLSGINIKVPKGSFVAIVGSVGSGKSTLLSALLGEMEYIKGRVNICGGMSIAYVAQQAWIQNSTLKENILFGLPFDSAKYKKVISKCALDPDIAYLPGGDETEIGEKGINLSGGQKQRVSLARACYSDSDLYFLDDPLSAVDAHVAKHLFDNVLSSRTGLLKKKTRVLVTNQLDILSKVDNIIVLKNGHVSEMGSYHDLMSSQKDFSELVKQFSNTNEEAQDKEEIERKVSSQNFRENDITRSQSVSAGNDKEKKLIEAEKAETGTVKSSVYVEYFKKVTFFWLTAVILGYAASTGFSLGSNVWLSKWSATGGNLTESDTRYFLGVYGILGGLQGLFILLGSIPLVYGTLRASIGFHKDLLYRVLRSPMSFFDTTPSGRIVNRFAKDIDTVDSVIPQTIRSWLFCFLNAISTFIIISIQTPLFIFVLLPVGFIYIFIQRIYVATSRQLKRLESITRSPIYSHFGETLNGVNTIRAFEAQDRFFAESNRQVDFNQSCYYSSIMSNRWLSVRLELCGNLIILSAATFAVLARNSLTGGDVGLSISYALSVTGTFNLFVRMSSELETNIVAVERILEYCRLVSEADWFVGKVDPKPDWPKQGQIVFENYGTRYRSGLELVVRNINAHIKPQEKVGIVGRTGAGKSTITQSLFRLIEPAEGKIMIDDHNISDLPLNPLRSRLAIIPQDPVLFSGTLRFNLDPFDKYTDQEIWESLSHAHLREFVSSLEEGLQYAIAEEGKNLSVGQRQLLCLARALLKKPKILFLDEATAAIDLETDSLIQATIRQELRKCTIMTIAHRLNTIMDSDRVMVLDHGQIAEFDTPENLLKNHDTIFYSLAKEANLVS
ncbi:multidrug resistance-associated protein 1-like [Brevipalpus obovatus]|uniref:multidrug resistance-associated protein 1-like n=1 Tax=Brevipalpus obovatus TaxID=246614 RepID=UPI003D9DD54A